MNSDIFLERIRQSIDVLYFLVSGKLFNEISELKRKIKYNIYMFNKCEYTASRGPLVSIIIPTRNESKYLPKLLLSLRNNCYKNIEIIVIDYKSNDKTVEIAEAWGAKVIEVDKPGIGYASHIGVVNAKGDIVIRTDADAIFPLQLISITVNKLINSTKFIYYPFHLYYDGNVIYNLLAFLYDKYWRKLWQTTGHYIAFKREIYDKIGGFNVTKHIHEDYDFGYRAYKVLGPRIFIKDSNNFILVSSRRIKRTGFLRYIIGIYTR